jgi:SAM-dependent methyltransferase
MVGASTSADSELRAFVRESPIHRASLAAAVGDAAAGLPAGARVLDAGAGSAPYRALFAHCEYRTQDWPSSVHDGARRSDIVADLHDLPIEDASFDFVLCTEVLEHVAEPARVLDELYRVLAPGGGLLLTVPFVVELHEEPYDHWRFTSHGLVRLLGDAGFAAIAVEPLSGWFTTLAQVLRNGGMAMRPSDRAARRSTRLAGLTTQALSVVLARFAGRLDSLDERRALPVGWACRATRPA